MRDKTLVKMGMELHFPTNPRQLAVHGTASNWAQASKLRASTRFMQDSLRSVVKTSTMAESSKLKVTAERVTSFEQQATEETLVIGLEHNYRLVALEAVRNSMKLRIKGNSLRLRVSRSELASLLSGDRIEETIHFTASPEAKLTYALDSAVQSAPISIQYGSQAVTVTLSEDRAVVWSSESEVGVYGELDNGDTHLLEVIVEKDFACLDGSDEDNIDTFVNPHNGATF